MERVLSHRCVNAGIGRPDHIYTQDRFGLGQVQKRQMCSATSPMAFPTCGNAEFSSYCFSWDWLRPCLMPFRFILPVFVVDIYRQGPDSMGLLVGLMGMGSLFSSLYVASMVTMMSGCGN